MKTERGFTLIETLVYIAVLAVVLDLSFNAYFRYDKHTRDLRRNADDITRAMRAGERWRDDIRHAVAPPKIVGDNVVIPEATGEVSYEFTDGTLWRYTSAGRIPMLKEVKASAMRLDQRQHVTAVCWELELTSPKKEVVVRPLFTFIAVPGGNPS